MAYGMDKSKNKVSARQVISGLEHDFSRADIDSHLKELVKQDIGRALTEMIEVKYWHDTEYDFHIYQAEAVVLPIDEYNHMRRELDRLRDNAKRLEHIILMNSQDRA